jgi:hypothetical protein
MNVNGRIMTTNLKEIGLWVWTILKLGIGSSGLLGSIISQKSGYIT